MNIEEIKTQIIKTIEDLSPTDDVSIDYSNGFHEAILKVVRAVELLDIRK